MHAEATLENLKVGKHLFTLSICQNWSSLPIPTWVIRMQPMQYIKSAIGYWCPSQHRTCGDWCAVISYLAYFLQCWWQLGHYITHACCLLIGQYPHDM